MAVSGCVGSDTGPVFHPFFNKPGDRCKPASTTPAIDSSQTSQQRATPDGVQQPTQSTHNTEQTCNRPDETRSSEPRPPTNVTSNNPGVGDNRRQWTLDRVFKAESLQARETVDPADQTASYAETDEENIRRKRRRLSHEPPSPVGIVTAEDGGQESSPTQALQGQPPIVESLAVQADEAPPKSTLLNASISTNLVDSAAREASAAGSEDVKQHNNGTPPRKMLRLSGSGKFSSPPAKTIKQEPVAGTQETLKRRGRPRKSKEPTLPKQLVVCIPYKRALPGEDHSAIAQKITDILAGTLKIEPPPQTPKKRKTPRKQTKATHPFFNDKPKPIKHQKPEPPRRAAAITPGKLRAQNKPESQHDADSHVFESALLKDRHIMKHPGAREPLWPKREMVHVRALPADALPSCTLSLRQRKLKNVQRPVARVNSLLSRYAQNLHPEPDGVLRADGYREPNANLHIPDRLLISASEILAEVVKQVKAPLRAGTADELSNEAPSQQTIHPAVQSIYTSIPSFLSGYDELRGETFGWATRHAPSRVAEVLQSSADTKVLKTWLQSLEVNAVGGAQLEASSSQNKTGKPRRKKRARPEDLDDFIVDEDDDDRSMVTISDSEGTTIAASSRSIVQAQVKGVKSSNVILISGPHGCGKTAAVYAVAKELNYRVFEISSSEKRAGKDVLDRIGNVTENHMVKHHGVDEKLADTSENDESDRIDAAFKRDLETGRQGKMSSFFTSRPAVKTSSSSTPTGKVTVKAKQKLLNTLQKAIKRPSKTQQQSFILLEEVDILFKDDKEFWNTVLRLMQSSKRPFILTCNDEDLVPVQALNLHAILRFTAPATDLAVDYLLLVAAKEGHILQREAVASLWESSGHDLRKCLASLDFWCRFGVGDVRDGLTWIYQRWPVGTDLDSKGHTLRVVSRGTYHTSLVEGAQNQASDTERQQVRVDGCLRHVDTFTSMLSDIDVFSHQHELDQTLPNITEKSRMHYIDGMMLLDTKEAADYTGLTSAMREFTTCQAERLLIPSQTSNISTVRWLSNISEVQLPRRAFAVFDGLANPVFSSSSPAAGMETSVFDRPLAPIVIDVAPYVRQILRHDLMLEEQRNALAGPGKKARKTRAAMSALEGGQRQLTRRQWWWEGVGDLRPVLATAGTTWADAVAQYQHEVSSSGEPEAISTDQYE